MAPALPRASFNGSRLVRLLAELAIVDVAEPQPSFAERLGRWLDWTDAISLSATLNAGDAAGAPEPRPGIHAAAQTAGQAFARVRTDLARSIRADAVFAGELAGQEPAMPIPGAAAEVANEFAPFRRSHATHQRAMETRIGPLRAEVREALSACSPGLGRLAALDAVLDDALAARERHLLSKVPSLLERYFERLSVVPRETRSGTGGPDGTSGPRDSAGSSPVPGWRAGFCKDMQAVLLAELEIRLHPVEGMIEALRNEVTRRS